MALFFMFLFLPVLVLCLSGMIALYAPCSCFSKRFCKLKFLRNCRPRRSNKKGFASWAAFIVKITLYIAVCVIAVLLISIGYLTIFSLVFVLSYIVLLPLFYFYSVFVLVRKLIIWREVRASAKPNLTKIPAPPQVVELERSNLSLAQVQEHQNQ